MEASILLKLKSAETDAEAQAAQAREQAKERVQAARTQAAERVQKAESEGRASLQATVDEVRKRLEAERDQILAQGKEQEAGAQKAYKARVDAAVGDALATFEGNL